MKGCVTRSRVRLPWLAALAAVLLAAPAAPAEPADIALSDPTAREWYRLALGAGDDLVIESGVVVEGSAHSNGHVLNKADSLVTGDLSAAGFISEKGTVQGQVVENGPARVLAGADAAERFRALADHVLTGPVELVNHRLDGLTFVEGWARLSGTISGRGTLVATDGIRVEAAAAGEEAIADDTLLSLVSLGEVHVGAHRRFRGAIFSGADLTVENNVVAEAVLMSASRLHLKYDSRVTFLPLDTTPPTVADLVPEAGRWLATRLPTFSGSFADDLSLVDPQSVGLTVIDVPVPLATVSVDGFTATPAEEVRAGERTAVLRFADHAGNAAEVAWTVAVDTQAPVVRVARPLAEEVTDSPVVTLAFEYLDTLSGIDPASLAVTVDGVAATCAAGATAAACDSPPLATGTHLVQVSVADAAGNAGTAEASFQLAVDLAPPTLAVAPPPGAWLATTPLAVTGQVSDDTGVTAVDVNGTSATVTGGTFSASVPLIEGPNPLTVTATDRFQRTTRVRLDVTFDSVAPEVAVTSPPAGGRVNAAEVVVRGRVRDDGGLAAFEVAGQPATVEDGEFAAPVTLAEGANALVVRAVDRAGNATEAVVALELYSLPEVRITAPVDLSYLATTTVDVTGEVTAVPEVVSVNGVLAEIHGTTFVARDVPLIEGGNIVTASAQVAGGRIGSATINVVRDTTAPRVEVRSPRQHALLVDETVTVSGLVNDIVTGTVNAGEATVTVNGRPARVANRSFAVDGVPLAPGDNLLEIVARDVSGNERRHSVTVRRLTGVPTVRKVSGDGQAGGAGDTLAQPLVVEARDAAGLPLPGRTVLFKVLRGDGSFGGERLTAVETGADGRASASFTLGGRAGAAAQAVEALLSGFAGGAVFAFDVAAGEPAAVVVDAGDQQVGAAGMALPRPLVAAVIDAGANRLAGVPVVLRVQAGGGHFAGGLQELRQVSDSDGRVVVPYVLGAEQGVGSHVVNATVENAPQAGVASFTATAWAAGEATDTAIVGVVLDNTDLPVPGVTLRILGDPRMAVADAQGQFRIANAPVGTVKLIVDGSTATRPGAWPDLEYVLTTVSGRDNDVGAPIRLLPLDLANGVVVSENRGGVLTLPEVPGFALDIAPGSVTFPSGSKNGVISVTAVHGDKVPMVPNFGQQPRLIVTIQPAGARFDPPARLTLPNVDGLAPGQVTEFYSFDHDLGHFVSIGPAAVAADGATVVSEPGVGILKAGWHCGGNPSASGTAHDCPTCQKCENDDCVPDDSQKPNRPCAELAIGDDITPASDWLKGLLNKVPYVDNVEVAASFSAESCPSCCDGSPLWVGEVSGGGSITASAHIQKTLSPFDFKNVGVENYALPFGIEVDLNATLQIGPFLRGVPSVSASVTLERDMCEGETCLTVDGCGGFTVDIGGTVTAELDFEIEVVGNDWIEWEPTIKGEVFGTWGGMVGGSYSWGCSDAGGSGDACYGDLAVVVEVEITHITNFTITQPILQGQEGCDGCG